MSRAAGIESSEAASLFSFAVYFLKLGALGFGGPIALAGHMQKDLVEERRWISREDYLEGLAFSQLSPGPLAAQLAMYLGWVRAGARGATVVGSVFVLPSFLMVLALAALYVHFGRLHWIQGLFYGIGAAVVSIIAHSAWKLAHRILGRDWFLWMLCAAVAVTTAWTQSEMVWLFVLCGILAIFVKAAPGWGAGAAPPCLLGVGGLFAGLHGLAPASTVAALFLFFLKAGSFVFGSGLAIVPFLYGGVVGQYHWLTPQQFLDAVAVAMITPGPVVITAAFIGYLVAGAAGAVAAAAAVFAPPYLIVVIGAPYYRRFAQNSQVKAFVLGVTAAAVGAIAGAAFVFAGRALTGLPTAGIAAVTLALLQRTRLPEPVIILAAGVGGLVLGKGQWHG